MSEYYSPFERLDFWIRHRIRLCFWKQGRYARTKVCELVKHGTGLKAALGTAISSNGPWRLSRTLATRSRHDQSMARSVGYIQCQRALVQDSLPGHGPVAF
ncbi:MAG: maturase [Phycisphaerae bacterium]|nr:maturase [Phycisphaerae bacterium]